MLIFSLNGNQIMKKLVFNLGLSLMCVVIVFNTSALANKAEDRWTRWKINKLKWEEIKRNLYKNEKIIPLEDRFAQHWSRMDRIEQKHIEAASLLRVIFPAENYSINFELLYVGKRIREQPEIPIK